MIVEGFSFHKCLGAERTYEVSLIGVIELVGGQQSEIQEAAIANWTGERSTAQMLKNLVFL
jgi:hypothetical protein